jgi:chromosome segregation ATPase
LSETEAAIASAEERRVMAAHEADSLEERNRIAVAELQKEISVKREVMLQAFDVEFEDHKQALLQFKESQSAVRNEIVTLEKERTSLQSEVKGLQNTFVNLTTDKSLLETTISEQKAESDNQQAQISDQQAQIESLNQSITELPKTKRQIEHDIEILRAEEEGLENRIIELDAEFKSRKETLDTKLVKITDELKVALESLSVAGKTDKRIRASWAEEHMKLEKREDSVRKMERRVKGLQDRAVELQNYLSL